jgi:hypothetical protein
MTESRCEIEKLNRLEKCKTLAIHPFANKGKSVFIRRRGDQILPLALDQGNVVNDMPNLFVPRLHNCVLLIGSSLQSPPGYLCIAVYHLSLQTAVYTCVFLASTQCWWHYESAARCEYAISNLSKQSSNWGTNRTLRSVSHETSTCVIIYCSL